MDFATIGHLDYKYRQEQIPKNWTNNKYIISPEIKFKETKGRIIALKLSAEQIMNMPREKIRKKILEASCFAKTKYNIELIQLGGLTTSVTSGGIWLTKQKEYSGYVNHGDSFTAAITSQTLIKTMKKLGKKPSEQVLSIIGAYGIIGEAVSKNLVPKFKHSILIGRRKEKLKELEDSVKGDFEISLDINTIKADIIITATSHPTALLKTTHLKKNAVVIDVSQPPNLSEDICKKRIDITRVDGGYVSFPLQFRIPGVPDGKLLACIVEVIMQAQENERCSHVGSIDLQHLKKTEKWAKKYGYALQELTNFGKPI